MLLHSQVLSLVFLLQELVDVVEHVEEADGLHGDLDNDQNEDLPLDGGHDVGVSLHSELGVHFLRANLSDGYLGELHHQVALEEASGVSDQGEEGTR